MKAWRGNCENIAEAQKIFLEKAKLCSHASLGKLEEDLSNEEECEENYFEDM